MSQTETSDTCGFLRCIQILYSYFRRNYSRRNGQAGASHRCTIDGYFWHDTSFAPSLSKHTNYTQIFSCTKSYLLPRTARLHLGSDAGGTGYIASELVKQLLEKGYNVRTTVRSKDPKKIATLTALSKALPGDHPRDHAWSSRKHMPAHILACDAAKRMHSSLNRILFACGLVVIISGGRQRCSLDS